MLLMFDINGNTVSILLQGDAGGANSGRSIASILKKAIMQSGAPQSTWYLSKKGHRLEKSTPPPVVAVVTNICYGVPSLWQKGQKLRKFGIKFGPQAIHKKKYNWLQKYSLTDQQVFILFIFAAAFQQVFTAPLNVNPDMEFVTKIEYFIQFQ